MRAIHEDRAENMASATEILRAAMTGTVRIEDTVRIEAIPARPQAYYLLWRMRASHPWHSEEFDNRNQAHLHYFALIQRGAEAYLEKRQRTGRSE